MTKHIVGRKFGRLSVVSRDEKRGKYWLCRCDCGTEKPVRQDHLLGNKTLSCGCLHSEQASKRAKKMHHANIKTGLSKSSTYQIWCNMKQRCQNPNASAWKDYGGRGIQVCDRWRTFENFLLDMGVRREGMTLDRYPDNDGNYEPGNCRWATRREQQNNRRVNRFITIGTTRMTVGQAAEKYGIPWKLLDARLKAGWPIERVILSRKQPDYSGLSLGGPVSGAKRKARTHCPHGHPYAGDNLRINSKTGGRECRACHADRERVRRNAKL